MKLISNIINFRIKITPKFIKQKNWLIFDNSGQQTGILRPPTIDTYRHNNTSNKQNFSTETIYNFDLKDPKYERPIEHISCKAKIKKELYKYGLLLERPVDTNFLEAFFSPGILAAILPSNLAAS